MPQGMGPVYDPLTEILQSIFSGSDTFKEWHNKRAIEDQQKFKERMRRNQIDEMYPGIDPRERMLLEYEMTKREQPGETRQTPSGVTPAQPPRQAPTPPSPSSSGSDPYRPNVPPEIIARLFPETEPGRGPGWLDPNNEAFVPQQVEPAYPSEGGFAQDEILRRFKELNPDLDYDAVARQSGGNVPGGSFSAVERKNVPKAQTDEEFIRWVNEDLPKYTASSMLDSRSREYNPEAAKIIFDRLAQERGDAAQMLYSRGQELRGQADLDKVQMLKRQAEFSRTPQGQMQSTIDFVLQNVDPALNADVFDKAIRARMALMNGQVEEAQRILQSIADTTDATQVANKTGQPVVG